MKPIEQHITVTIKKRGFTVPVFNANAMPSEIVKKLAYEERAEYAKAFAQKVNEEMEAIGNRFVDPDEGTTTHEIALT